MLQDADVMTTNVKQTSCSPISTTNERVEQDNTQQSPATIHAIQDGTLLDSKTVRISVSHRDSGAIELLKKHYGAKLGTEVSLTKLISLLVEQSVKDSLQVDVAFINKALKVGLQVEMPDFSRLKFGGSV